MRKLVICLLLVTTAAMPALAQDRDGRRDRADQSASSDDNGERNARRAERAERRTERAERRAARPAPSQAQPERVRPLRDGSMAPVRTPVDSPRRVLFDQRAALGAQTQTQQRRERGGDRSIADVLLEHRRDSIRDGRIVVDGDRAPTTHRRDDRRGRDDRRAGHGEYHRDVNREHGDLHASDPSRREHRDWHRGVTRQHDRRHYEWDSRWRDNRSYDWRRYRHSNQSIFHFGSYYDPYGYGYRRFSIGFNLWPSYYGSSFWLSDPWQYRLPPAYGPYRWVRYYDDALLVNIYTGQVVDVEHNFFW
ncbi:MAG: RcnB family protein [Pseudomonadota bacterium]|nr:RcnB family protein [Pseudomonadota bacterium]